ncbi:hypothetical protein PZN02_004478 [Sinorhizobium garamanticum]|uniref:Uncharacterized protein n=1 Tax=Sinorhizobium garamanticum TaxID=680247 RepID=A0ABY8DJ33_9HYPH|nr:hypothetical protein [Sinorhizobium garamanticum]WEX90899.1 hypothetical protein PZN02_004478 [Sinorhizobium garamanticum]
MGAIEPAFAQATGGIESVLENIVTMLTAWPIVSATNTPPFLL